MSWLFDECPVCGGSRRIAAGLEPPHTTDDDPIDYEALQRDLDELETTDPEVSAAARAYRPAVTRIVQSPVETS